MEMIVLIGIPGSGKSTFYEQRFASSHVLISKDRLPNRQRSARRQEAMVREAFTKGQSVIVDNTNPTRHDREVLFALASEFKAPVIGYYFPTNAAEAIVRNRARTGKAQVPAVAIYTSAKRLQPPVMDEGFNELYTVRIADGGRFEVQRQPQSDH
jgi:predicted kinase